MDKLASLSRYLLENWACSKYSMNRVNNTDGQYKSLPNIQAERKKGEIVHIREAISRINTSKLYLQCCLELQI